MEKISKAIFFAVPFKKSGLDNIFAIVKQKLWPIIKSIIVSLFIVSVGLGVIPKQ